MARHHHKVPSMSLTSMLLLLALVLFVVFFFSRVWKKEGMQHTGNKKKNMMGM